MDDLQILLLRQAVNDVSFTISNSDKIKCVLKDQIYVRVFEIIMTFFITYKQRITQNTFLIIISSMFGNNLMSVDDELFLRNLSQDLFNPTSKAEKDFLKQELNKIYVTERLKKEVLMPWEDLMHNCQFEQLASTVLSIVHSSEPRSTMNTIHFISDLEQLLDEPDMIYDRTMVPIGLGFDSDIGGGMGGGCVGLIMGSTKVGKTTSLVHGGCYVIQNRRKALIYSLELKARTLFMKVLSNLYDQDIVPLLKSPQTKNTIFGNMKANLSWLFNSGSEFLVIEDFAGKKVSMNDIEADVEGKRADGFKPDVIFIDYLKKLKPSRFRGEKRIELGEITEEMHDFSKRVNLPVWTAHQANRGSYNKDYVTIENVQEDWSIPGTCDVNIVIYYSGGLSKQDIQYRSMRREKIWDVTINLDSQRHGASHLLYDAKVDYSKSKFYNIKPFTIADLKKRQDEEEAKRQAYDQKQKIQDIVGDAVKTMNSLGALAGSE